MPNFAAIGQTIAEMAIFLFFDFSKMVAVRHLGFVMSVFGPPTKGIWWSLSQNLVGIDAVVLITCMFFDFSSLAGKRLFRPQNWGFWGFDPLNGESYQRHPKRHILGQKDVT